MTLSVSYRVPVNGTHQPYPVPALIKAVMAQNLSGDVLNVDPGGGNAIIRIPAGMTQSWLPEGSSQQVTVWTDSSTTGEAWLYAYDSAVDISQNTNIGAQTVTITNATLNVNGAVTATLAAGSTVNIGSTVTIQGTGLANAVPVQITQTLTVNATITNSSLNVAITNATLNVGIVTAAGVTFTVTDSLVENNTTVLTGLLPKNVASLAVPSNGSVSQVIATAISAFAIAFVPVDGFYDILYVFGGITVYVASGIQGYFGITQNSQNPIEKVYVKPIPAAATLTVRNRFAVSGATTAVLKW